MKNTFHGPITGLDTAQEGISELKNMTTEYSKTEKQRGKNRPQYPELGTTTKDIVCMKCECQKEKKESDSESILSQ